MSAVQPAPALDPDKLNAFVFRAVEEVGATLNAALVVMGDKLGLYRAMAGAGPLDPGRARRARPAWRSATSASGSTTRPPAATSSTTPAAAGTRSRPSRRVALTDADSPAYLPGVFQIALGAVTTRPGSPRPRGPGRASAGTSTPTTCSRAASGSSAPATTRTSSATWLPALDGVDRQARGGRHRRRHRLRARRLDDPHGAGVPHGRRSPARTTTPARSRPRASGPREAGVGDRVALRGRRRPPTTRAAATTSSRCSTACTTWATPSAPPATCARSLAPDGTWMIVEPARRRPRRGQPQPGRTRVLRVLDAPVHPRVAVAGGRAGARRPGGRGAHPRRRRGGRVHALPPRRRDAVQPRVRGAPVGG